jgi:hypothetical protein
LLLDRGLGRLQMDSSFLLADMATTESELLSVSDTRPLQLVVVAFSLVDTLRKLGTSMWGASCHWSTVVDIFDCYCLGRC